MKKRNKNGMIIKQFKRKTIKTPIIDQCKGCEKVAEEFCVAYANPKEKWRLGNCPLATNIKTSTDEKKKKRIGQQKQRR